MDSIDQLNNKFIESAQEDLKQYCERQYKEIVRLLSENKKLEDEVVHLKQLLVNGTNLIQPAQILSAEELICIKQIEELKSVSDTSLLTLEESKKLDTYVKILRLIRSNSKEAQQILSNVKTDDLLKLVEDENVKA